MDDQVFECDIPVAKADEGDDGDTSGKVSLTCEQVVHQHLDSYSNCFYLTTIQIASQKLL